MTAQTAERSTMERDESGIRNESRMKLIKVKKIISDSCFRGRKLYAGEPSCHQSDTRADNSLSLITTTSTSL